MSKFKVGDRVRRTGPDFGDVVEGGEYVLSDILGGYLARIEGSWGFYCLQHFELVEENKMQKQFTKNDLKTGMRVVRPCGKVGLIVKDLDIISYEDGRYVDLSSYTEDMTYKYAALREFDIDTVYSGTTTSYLMDLKQLGKLLWKREEKSPEQIEAENITKEIESLKLRLEELSKKI